MSLLLRCSLSFLLLASAVFADKIPVGLLGDWSLDLDSKEPSWLRMVEDEKQGPLAYLRVYVGPKGPFEITEIKDGKIHFVRRSNKKTKAGKVVVKTEVEVGLVDGKLVGKLRRPNDEGIETVAFTGERIPKMPKQAPDLSKVKFGHPILLFNGKDLSGWRTYESDKINGWRVKDGELMNTTTKTDFSATGDHANLRTEAEFEDFWLHAEFLIGENRNSGIYLRGIYEAQVVDRDSRMQGKQGPERFLEKSFPPVTPESLVGNGKVMILL